MYLLLRFEKGRIFATSKPNCGNSSVGRARPCQGRGRGFESRFPLKEKTSDKEVFFLIS